MCLHAVCSTRVSGIQFSTQIPLKFPKFSVLVTLSSTLMIRGHYFSYSAGFFLHFLTLIKLYSLDCKNTAIRQDNTKTEGQISECVVYYPTNVFSFLHSCHDFIIELYFCSLNLQAETMCQKCCVVFCYT